MALVAVMPDKIYLEKANTQTVRLIGLKDDEIDEYIITATVTAVLKDRSGNPVEPFPLSLSYVDPAIDKYHIGGTYRIALSGTFDPAKGGGYTMVYDAVDGDNKLHLEIPAEVKIRKN